MVLSISKIRWKMGKIHSAYMCVYLQRDGDRCGLGASCSSAGEASEVPRVHIHQNGGKGPSSNLLTGLASGAKGLKACSPPPTHIHTHTHNSPQKQIPLQTAKKLPRADSLGVPPLRSSDQAPRSPQERLIPVKDGCGANSEETCHSFQLESQ